MFTRAVQSVKKLWHDHGVGGEARRQAAQLERFRAESYRRAQEDEERERIQHELEQKAEVAQLVKLRARGYRAPHRGESIDQMVSRLLAGGSR